MFSKALAPPLINRGGLLSLDASDLGAEDRLGTGRANPHECATLSLGITSYPVIRIFQMFLSAF